MKHVQNSTKLFTDSFNMANTQSSIKSSSKWSFYTVQISNFNWKSAWKSITDQSKFSKLSRKACCLDRCEGACQWRLELRWVLSCCNMTCLVFLRTYKTLLYLSDSTRAVVGQFYGPYSTVRPAKFDLTVLLMPYDFPSWNVSRRRFWKLPATFPVRGK